MKGFIEIEFDERKRLIAVQSIVGVSEAKAPGYHLGFPDAPTKTTISLSHGIKDRPGPGSTSVTQLMVDLTYQEVLDLIEAAL
jgi:hypothetical protein